MPRAHPSLLIIAAALLTGCGQEGTLPPPGSQGPILIRQWDGKGRRQVVVKAMTVEQAQAMVGKDFDQLDMGEVLIRLPYRGDVICVASPDARYSASGDRRIDLGGPVNLCGALQGETVIGSAASAWLNAGDQSLELADLRLTWRGTLSLHPRVRMHQDQGMQTTGASSTMNAPVMAVAALAALPRPLVVPDLTSR